MTRPKRIQATVVCLTGLITVAGMPTTGSARDEQAATPAERMAQLRSECQLAGADRSTTSSRSCLGCHDGSTASAPSFRTDTRSSGNGAHPLGLAYRELVARHDGALHSEAALPPQIVLVHGTVECTTCHDGASELPHRLALPVAGDSALCVACHRK